MFREPLSPKATPGKLYRVLTTPKLGQLEFNSMELWKNTWVGSECGQPGYHRNQSLGQIKHGDIILIRSIVNINGQNGPREYYEILSKDAIIGYIHSDFGWFTLEPFMENSP